MDIKNIAEYVNTYNTNIEQVQKALETIGSDVKLETINNNAIQEKIDKLKEDGDKIIKELKDIETYTDIFSMREFVKSNTENGGMNQRLFLTLVIGILLLLHGFIPTVDIQRTKSSLKEQIKFLKKEANRTKNPWLTNMINNVFPIIEKTELGKELLVQEGNYTLPQLYDYLNNYKKYGQIKP
ncbi:MAG: hypothetical protein LBP53_02070 [Candidatus Peribacteria bacterium]|nr:hypothetical protein [Candidatus Peribacteria bacterium]